MSYLFTQPNKLIGSFVTNTRWILIHQIAGKDLEIKKERYFGLSSCELIYASFASVLSESSRKIQELR